MPSTDTWRKVFQFLRGSRLDYKIVVDDEPWLLDPLNPYRQRGGAQHTLPVLYVTDGPDYAHDEMGAMIIVLDNLAANGIIEPLRVVFIDQRDPRTPVNRRVEELIPAGDGSCRFCAFLVDELVPAIDSQYPTEQRAARRGLIGIHSPACHAWPNRPEH